MAGSPVVGSPVAGTAAASALVASAPVTGGSATVGFFPAVRPMTVADVLDGPFRMVRAAPAAVLVPALLVAVLETLLRVGIDRAIVAAIGSGFASAAISVWVGLVISVTAVAIGAGFMAAAARAALAGQPVTLGRCWATVRARLPALLSLAALIGLLSTLALSFLAVPGIWLWTAWSVAAAVLVIEDTGVGAAVRRSWQLVHGRFWRVLGLLLLATVITSAFGYLAQVPFALLGQLIGHGSTTSLAALAITSLGGLLGAAITVPIRAGVAVMIYLDQRIRREAFDVTLALNGSPLTGNPVMASPTGLPRSGPA